MHLSIIISDDRCFLIFREICMMYTLYICEKFVTRPFQHCEDDQNRNTDSCGNITTWTSAMVTNFRTHLLQVWQAKQETLAPWYLVSPLITRGPWMSTMVLCCLRQSYSASALMYFTNNSNRLIFSPNISSHFPL